MSNQPPRPSSAPPPLPPDVKRPPMQEVPVPHFLPQPQGGQQQPPQAAVQQTASPETSPLTPLQLNTIFQSPEPIIEPDKVQSVTAWHDFTIIVPKGTDPMIIVDKFGRKVSDFDSIGYKIPPYINWQDLGKTLGKTYIASKKGIPNFDRTTDIPVSELPYYLQDLARAHLREGDGKFKRFTELPKDQEYSSTLEDIENYKIVVCKDTDTIFIYSDNQLFYFYFITRNEQGALLPPRNWKRQEAITISSSVPKALKPIFTEITNGITKLNDKYSAKIVDPDHDQVHILSEGNSVYTDNITGVGNNICSDSSNPDIIYYCKKDNPNYLRRLDTSGNPNAWEAEEIPFPAISQVNDLDFEPNGAFFTFHTADGLLVMLEKDTLQPVDVSQVPSNLELKFDNDGRIRRIDENGHLVIQDINLDQVAAGVKARRVAGMARRIDVGSLFQRATSSSATPQHQPQLQHKDYSYLNNLRTTYEPQFAQFIGTIQGVEDFDMMQEALDEFEAELRKQGLQQDEVDYVVENVREMVVARREEIAAVKASELIHDIRGRLSGALTVGNMAEVREKVDEMRKLKPFVANDVRTEMNSVSQGFERQVANIFRMEGAKIQQEIDALTVRVRSDLESFETLGEFNDWSEFKLPKIIDRLSTLAQDCPAEADEIHAKIIAARREVREVANEYKEKFKHQYQDIRAKAARRIDGLKTTIEDEIKEFAERLRMKKFTDRTEAENYRDKSPSFRALNDEITRLRGDNPDAAIELHNIMQAQLSVVFSEIERGTKTQVSETGQEMVEFGNVLFPKWEGEVREKVEPSCDPCYIVDEGSKQVGIGIDGIMGDIGVRLLTSYGRTIIRRLFEGEENEDELRYGLQAFHGVKMPASYMDRKQYMAFQRAYNRWMQKHSELRRKLAEKKKAIDEHNTKKPADKTSPEFSEWATEAKRLYRESAEFYAKNFIALLRRIDRIRELPEEEYENGKGIVPEWQMHWVDDPETEMHLANMAKKLAMQDKLKEGCLLLKGHAGTGKDVLIKMFCERARRQYFAMDCTKWTTEFELSEDIILESRDGASQTVKVPSMVLNAITTPGAVMYFNEFNAMPHQAQIFLHALFDEKRSLTLKTSSGQTIKAHKSVLFAASMNPNYPGTFAPQIATRSRFNSYEIGYPKMREDATAENPNPKYLASEALRIARGVESLIKYTWDANMDKNQFVKMWNVVVNGESDPSVLVSDEEKFDIEVILALVQFGNKIRDNFILKFGKSINAIKALPVEQPFTLREARRCAYLLSQMTPEQKAKADPEQVAKDLIAEEFLFQIDDIEDRETIEKDMRTNWTMEKRVAAA